MATLIDTNVLLAASFTRDQNHQVASQLLRKIEGQRIVVSPVLVELFYMTTIRINYHRAIEVMTLTSRVFAVEELTPADMNRMIDIMKKYADAEFDYTDIAIMAVAERLNIERIATLDRRDFLVYRPAHCEHFTLLPEQ